MAMLKSLQMQFTVLLSALFIVLLVQFFFTFRSQTALITNQSISHNAFIKVEIISKLERDVIDLQRMVLIYKETASEVAISRFKDLLANALKNLNTLNREDQLQLDEDSRELLQQMHHHLTDYEENFDAVVDNRRRRLALFEDHAQKHFLDLINNLEQPELQNDSKSLQILNHILKARSLSFQYRYSPDYQYAEAFFKELETAHALLVSTAPKDVKLWSLMYELKQDFSTLVDITRAYVFLANVVMAGSANEFLYAAKALREKYTTQQTAVLDNSKSTTKEIHMTTIVVSILVFLISSAFAFSLISRILWPVKSLTEVFNTLAKGQGVDQIPNTDRRDEIGLLANAANIFRHKNEQTQELLQQSRAMVRHQEKLNRELKEARDKAEYATRSKSMFLANMSHEIRTPMNGIIGLVALTQKTVLSERQKHYLEKIAYSSQVMMGVINDILDFSKIEAGKLDIEYSEFPVSNIIENIISVNISKVHEQAINFRIIPDTVLPEKIISDELRINQIFLNLCNNAIKFTPHGEVNLHLGYEEDSTTGQCFLKASVIDTGIGMDEHQLAIVFDSFTQADGTTSRKYGGTGLGLAIVKQLVDLLDGEITVSSNPGKGSCFSLRVAVKVATEAPHERAPQSAAYFPVLEAPLAPNLEYFDSFDTLSTYDINTIHPDSIQTGLILIECPSRSYYENHQARISQLQQLAIPVAFITDTQPDSLPEFLNQETGCPVISQPLTHSKLENIRKLAATPLQSATVDKAEENTPQLQGVVLLAEDNMINQIVACGMLEDMGLTYDLAENGQEAVEKIKAGNHYDLVLMDIQMPVMDGYEATRQLRSEGYNELIICGLSANAMPSDVETAKEVGMNNYLTKPIDEKELQRVLYQYLNTRQVT